MGGKNFSRSLTTPEMCCTPNIIQTGRYFAIGTLTEPQLPQKVFLCEVVYLVASELDKGKSPEKDDVPAKFFKFAPLCILELVAHFFNSFLCH